MSTEKQVAPGIVEVNSSTLIIGPTGSGKTALLATAYEYVWEEHKRISLHYNSDPGGFPDKLRALISVGIVRVWRMQSRGIDLSFESADLAAKGYWPAKVDPKSGISPRGVRLIPPVVTLYVETCGHCNQEAGRSIVLALLLKGLCPHCQKVRTPQTGSIQQIQTVSRGFENVGTRGYDGLTSISDWYLQDLSMRKDLGGEEGALGGRVISGDQTYRQNNRSQVGFAQSRAQALITNSLEIPGMIVMPLWTAITNETTDQGGLPVIGPKLAGDAKTDIAPQWFGNVFETTVVETANKRKQRRVYLSQFIDDQNRRHLLRHRGDGRLVPEYVEDPPYEDDGRPPVDQFSKFNLGHVFRLLDASLAQTVDEIAAKYPDAPGLDAVPSEYGMDVPKDLPAPAVQTAPDARPIARARPRPRGAATNETQTAATPASVVAQESSVAALPVQAGSAAAEAPAPAPAPPAVPAQEAPPAPVAAAPASPAPGAWAPPPGAARIAPPRAPAAAPRARPIARPK